MRKIMILKLPISKRPQGDIMKILGVLLLSTFTVSAFGFEVHGSLKEVQVGMLGVAIPAKIIESSDGETYIVDFYQGNRLSECKAGSYELSQVTSNDVEGYDSFKVESLECLSL